MLTLNELLKIPALEVSNLQSSEQVLRFSTDTRKFDVENAFIALRGEKFDGFHYADQVLSKGCKAIAFQRSQQNEIYLKQYQAQFTECTFICVENIETYLHLVAHSISKKFYQSGGKVICISGSNGKTTTKEMVFHLLSRLEMPAIKTLSNNNNHIGVPLTLFQITPETRYAVVELGSNHPGEIPKLCEILDPHVGYTTNIGHTHLEFFDNLENVFKEEAFLYGAVSKSSKTPRVFLVNNYDPFLKNIRGADCVFLSNDTNGITVTFNKCSLKFKGKTYDISNSNLTGKHNFFNIAAAAVLVHLVSGQSFEEIIPHAQTFKPTNNRSQWLRHKNGAEIFMDAYNANPSSMKEAVEGFYQSVMAAGASDDQVLFILGDMNELGKNGEHFHVETGKFLSENKFKNVWFIGRFAPKYLEGFPSGKVYASTKEGKVDFQEAAKSFKYIFIKGSRSLQLESILDIT